MKQRFGAFSLLGVAAISTLTLPAFANTASQQIGTQSATIDGNNNNVIQVINQVNISHPGLGRGLGNNPRRGTTQSTVQDSYQTVTIDGDGNSVYQETNQINQQQTNPGRGGDARRDDDDDDKKHGRGRDRDDDDDD
ncbi:hypothetical protein IQ254_16615 [Nodosilinea sp. LEGE 07088]|uniref:hypothetical protein n=1 Tax=Nodosilinea sp. LEGE 07088 TaxID=2777968 RepID=UPI0018802854|nr:hypothetical protein [Nodosilinea sp. LEGE 07088]MBE9138796.1 hypothetical protein [Nodosilinea sp. LEGE 07088]